MHIEEHGISGSYLRGFLAGIRKVTGAQYSSLLEEVGLARYILRYPPPTQQIVIQASQLFELSELVRQAVGTELYGLYLRNFGRELARNAFQLEGLHQAVQQLGSLRNQLTLQAALELMADRFNSLITGEVIKIHSAPTPTPTPTPTTPSSRVSSTSASDVTNATNQSEAVVREVSVEKASVIIVYEGCTGCVICGGVKELGCLSIVAFYRELLYLMTHRRLEVREISCALTQGGRDCSFLVKA